MTPAAPVRSAACAPPSPPTTPATACSTARPPGPSRPPAHNPAKAGHRKEPPVSLYAIIREAGPGWTSGKGAFGQPGASDHAAFMNTLAGEGFVLFAGPLAGSEHGAPDCPGVGVVTG